MPNLPTRICLFHSALAAACMPVAPLNAAESYAGKTIELVVGAPPGGGYDIYARTVGRHLGRHIPGEPTVVVKNMPGAGSAKAAQYIASIAPKDGTSIGGIMILDSHSHIFTPEEAADDLRTWDGNTGPSWGERGCPMVLENFVRAHQENNINISVVTNAAHYLKGKRADEELPSVQAWSDYAAKVQQDHKGMLIAGASTLRPSLT